MHRATCPLPAWLGARTTRRRHLPSPGGRGTLQGDAQAREAAAGVLGSIAMAPRRGRSSANAVPLWLSCSPCATSPPRKPPPVPSKSPFPLKAPRNHKAGGTASGASAQGGSQVLHSAASASRDSHDGGGATREAAREHTRLCHDACEVMHACERGHGGPHGELREHGVRRSKRSGGRSTATAATPTPWAWPHGMRRRLRTGPVGWKLERAACNILLSRSVPHENGSTLFC